MNIMNRTERYRLEALVELGWVYPSAIPVAEIARRRHIPPAYLSRLIGDLTRAGWVRSRRGPGGGVALVSAPDALHLDTMLLLECDTDPGSPAVERLGETLARSIRETLRTITLGQLMAWDRERSAAPEYMI
jgi:Rrf2 family protein